jgi:hypothetical protein
VEQRLDEVADEQVVVVVVDVVVTAVLDEADEVLPGVEDRVRSWVGKKSGAKRVERPGRVLRYRRLSRRSSAASRSSRPSATCCAEPGW